MAPITRLSAKGELDASTASSSSMQKGSPEKFTTQRKSGPRRKTRTPDGLGSQVTVHSSSLNIVERNARTDLKNCNVALGAVGLVPPHGADLSRATSGISSGGPKPCSTSQRTLSRHRNDHHARMRSRSTLVP